MLFALRALRSLKKFPKNISIARAANARLSTASKSSAERTTQKLSPTAKTVAAAGVGAVLGSAATYGWLISNDKKAAQNKSANAKVKIIPGTPQFFDKAKKSFAAVEVADFKADQTVYPDFLDQIPAGYEGSVFKLSQNYPKELPVGSLPKFFKTDFIWDPMRYMQEVRDYVYDGNLESEWRPENNTKGKWFHVPWMHVGRNPREFMHGLTRERDSSPKELGEKQTVTIQNWAVGLYNEIGGYTIGQVWPDSGVPNPKAGLFKNGAVVVKILFTEATTKQVPELEGSYEWDANVFSTLDRGSPKAIKKLRLLQMDIAVRDTRADETTGWVFGTFVYDKSAPGNTPWEKMVPVGLMWGNDPNITPKDIENGAKLKESIINPNMPVYARKRLGWGGRLNGPVDNFVSACTSCHSTAQWKTQSPLIPPNNASVEERLRWFRNIKPGQSFDEGQIPLDYSLQLAVAIQNYFREQEIEKAINTSTLVEPPAKASVGFTISR